MFRVRHLVVCLILLGWWLGNKHCKVLKLILMKVDQI